MMKPPSGLLPVLLFLAVVMGAACSAGPAGELTQASERTVILLGDLEDEIQIADQRQDYLPSGFLRFGATVRSKARSIVRIETRFQWFDYQGFAVGEEGSAWKPAQVDPGDTLDIVGVAPRTEAVRCRLTIRAENPYVGDPDAD